MVHKLLYMGLNASFRDWSAVLLMQVLLGVITISNYGVMKT